MPTLGNPATLPDIVGPPLWPPLPLCPAWPLFAPPCWPPPELPPPDWPPEFEPLCPPPL
jgi:hypothetical protein